MENGFCNSHIDIYSCNHHYFHKIIIIVRIKMIACSPKHTLVLSFLGKNVHINTHARHFYVIIYMNIHICIRINIFLCMNTNLLNKYIYIHMYIYIYIYEYIHEYIYIHRYNVQFRGEQ
jgi:hypothetical protein